MTLARRSGATPLFAVALAAVTLAGPLAHVPSVHAAPADGGEPGADDVDPAARKAARAHFKKGEKLYALGRFDEALAEYQQAFDSAPLPEFLFNIGQCQRNLKRYDEAIFSFKKYLHLSPDAPNRKAVEELIAELEQDRERARADGDKGDPNLVAPPPAHAAARPFYKKWWFVTGVVLVAGAAVTGVVLLDRGNGLPSSDLGNLDFPK